MANIYEENSRTQEERQLPSASLNPAGLVILACIIALIPGLIVYWYIHVKEASLTTKLSKTLVSQMQKKPSGTPTHTPQPTSVISLTPTVMPTITQGTLSYTVPAGYEAVKVFGDENVYQIAFRQKGSTDSPIVLNVYRNTLVSFSDFIAAQGGNTMTQEKQETKGSSGIYAKGEGSESYFLSLAGAYIQLAAVTGDQKIHSYFTSIYSSLQAK